MEKEHPIIIKSHAKIKKVNMRLLETIEFQATSAEEFDENKANKLWLKGANLAKEFLSIEPNNSELLYARGFFLYMYWARTGLMWSEAKELFIAALTLTPNHFLAKFYLACLHFETGQFNVAKPLLWEIYTNGMGYFQKLRQKWRILKALEMFLASQIRLNQKRGILKNSCLLKKAYEANAKAKYSSFQIPITIICALEDTFGSRQHEVPFIKVINKIGEIIKLTDSYDFIEKRFPKITKFLTPSDLG